MTVPAVSEASDAIDAVVLEVIGRIDRIECAGAKVIAVAGGSCSGKSTVARRIMSRLGSRATLLCLDDFQLGEAFPLKDVTPYRWDDPENFSPSEAAAVLAELKAGCAALSPTFDLPRNRRSKSQRLEPAEIIVFEGLYTLSEVYRANIEFGLFVDTPFFGRFLRRIFRFVHNVDPHSPEVPVKHMVRNVYPAHAEFVAPQRTAADLTFSNPYRFADEALRHYALADVSLGTYKGDLLYHTVLPEGVELQVTSLESNEERVGFSVTWNGQCVYQAPVDKSLVGDFCRVSWHSH